MIINLNRGLGKLNRGLMLKGGQNGKNSNNSYLGISNFLNKFINRSKLYDKI